MSQETSSFYLVHGCFHHRYRLYDRYHVEELLEKLTAAPVPLAA